MKKVSAIAVCSAGISLFSLFSCGNKKQPAAEQAAPVQEVAIDERATLPPANPYLLPGDYVAEHFGPAQGNLFTNKVKSDSYQVYAAQLQEILPTCMPTMLLQGKSAGHYWLTDMNRIYYLDMSGDSFKPVAQIMLSGKPADSKPDAAVTVYADTFYTTGAENQAAVRKLFGKDADKRIENGRFPLVDKDNTLYTFNNRSLIAVELNDPADPSKGLKIARQLDISKLIPADDYIVGMQMSYDGYLVINSHQGLFGVVDRTTLTLKNQLQIVPLQHFFAGVAIDDKNGVYTLSDSLMIKMVWNGTNLSLSEQEGAWNCPITYLKDSMLIKQGGGVLSAPVLMGFGNDPDKLVIISDGAAKANLIAFWRDSIPSDFTQKPGTPSKRIAGMIGITLGIPAASAPAYIQSYHTLPVWGYGVAFINTINGYQAPVSPMDYAVLGAILPNAKGVERFVWDYARDEWMSVWSAPEVGCSATEPVLSQHASLLLLNAFDQKNQVEGWTVKGYDWKTGAYTNEVVFSANTQYGNGGAGYFQYLPDGDMIFNSLTGSYRLTFGEERGLNRSPRL